MNLRRLVRDLFGVEAESVRDERDAKELLLDRRSFLAGSLVAALMPAPKAYSFGPVLGDVRSRVPKEFWDALVKAPHLDEVLLPSDQSHVTLALRVFTWFKNPSGIIVPDQPSDENRVWLADPAQRRSFREICERVVEPFAEPLVR